MKTTKTIGLLSFGLLLGIFLINIVNAQTLVAGKIYNSDYSSIVSGASVSVTCKSSSLDTVSLIDGTYAVRFEQSQCTLGDSVKVSASKDSLSGENSGTVIACEGDGCTESDYVSVLNLNIKTKTSSSNSGGGSGRYYYCGNGRCDSGETERTCPKDCKVVSLVPAETTEDTDASIYLTNGETNPENEDDGQTGGITGAVVGALGNIGILITLIFLICLIVLYVIVMIVRRRKRLEVGY